jgi:peptide deformylase
MAVLPIIMGEKNPVLRQKTKKVPRITKDILKLIDDMDATREHAVGAGIAAPQVGRSERLCIAMINKRAVPLINPFITRRSDKMETGEEGCLSLPDVWIQVPRSKEIDLQYQDAKGRKQELTLSDWDARVVQHEVDHLDGVLIVDYAL